MDGRITIACETIPARSARPVIHPVERYKRYAAMAADVDPAWRNARRILAVRLDNLGDVLVTTPAIHAIRECLPAVCLTALVSPVGEQVARLNPDVDDVLVYQAPWMDPWKKLPQEPARELAMVETLRQGAFDAAIIFTSFRQSSLPSAYLCYLAGIPLRLAASIDGSGSLLTTRHRHPAVMMHEVERGLDLVAAAGLRTEQTDLVLKVPDEAHREAEALVARLRHASGPLVVVHPGCSMPARTYPADQYVGVADLLAERLGATVVLTGAPEERELTDRIAAQMRTPAVNVAGDLSFPTFCALIEMADLTVTNNTGPMHISAAVKTPVVALFALTNPPEQWGPWQVPHRQLYHDVSCRLCYQRICPYNQECLRLVTPEMVVEAAGDLLDEVADQPEPVLAGTG